VVRGSPSHQNGIEYNPAFDAIVFDTNDPPTKEVFGAENDANLEAPQSLQSFGNTAIIGTNGLIGTNGIIGTNCVIGTNGK